MAMFRISAEERIKGTAARTGVLHTRHGKLTTPFFMPVATKGGVKYLPNKYLEECGTECIISNALLLYMKPGLDIIREAKGIHSLFGWEHGIFTDSGGFQLLRPEFLLETNAKGAWFRNPFDQSKAFFSPEKCMEVQEILQSDVAMALDDVLHFGEEKADVAASLKKTMDWMERCKNAHRDEQQLLFGISQGGVFTDLRKKSVQHLVGLELDGIALGGLCIGEARKEREKIVQVSKQHVPEEKPVYLMGVGSAPDLVNSIALGMDVFDSAFPTRTARHGMAITSFGNLQLEKSKFREDFTPLDKECTCYVCKSFSRAFLHHLISTREENGGMYLSMHNLHFVQQLMEESRKAIEQGYFESFRKEFLSGFGPKG